MTALDRARAALRTLTPLRTDCGACCGNACCRPDADGQGYVYLFPGEDVYYKEEKGDMRVLPGDFAPMLACPGACDRDNRPLGCRIFPLTPVPLLGGGYRAAIDRRALAMCPLARGAVRGLDPEFVDAVEQVFCALARDPEMDAFLRAWRALEKRYGDLAGLFGE